MAINISTAAEEVRIIQSLSHWGEGVLVFFLLLRSAVPHEKTPALLPGLSSKQP